MDVTAEARRWLERRTGVLSPYARRLEPLDGEPRRFLQHAAERLGSPHRAFPVVHVAGSSGKGTTAWLCARILEESGLRTGLSWSPHLTDERERALVSFRKPPRESLARAVLEIAAASEDAPGRPTWAGVMALAALLVFREAGADAAVMECGLGGAHDATGFMEAPVCILTSVEAEHTERLGRDTALIAAEKAAIASRGALLVCAPLGEAELAAARAVAEERGAAFETAGSPSDPPRAVSEALARRAAERAAALAGKRAVIPPGFSSLVVPGRDHLLRKGGLTVLLDGAHTPASLALFARAVSRRFRRPPRLLFGCTPPRRPEELLPLVAPACSEAVTVVPSPGGGWRSPGSDDPDPVGSFLSRGGEAVVTGSFHLVGEVMKRLGVEPFGDFGQNPL